MKKVEAFITWIACFPQKTSSSQNNQSMPFLYKSFLFSILSCLLLLNASAQQLSSELKTALKEDNVQLLKTALSEQHLNECYETGSKSYNLLALSIKIGANNVLEHLLKAGANIEDFCADKSPLMYAAKYGKLRMTKLLIKHGADPTLVLSDKAPID